MTIDGGTQTLANKTTNPGTPGANFTVGGLSDGSRLFPGETDEVSAYTADIRGSTAAAHLAAGRRTDTTTAITTGNGYDQPWGAWVEFRRLRAALHPLGMGTEWVEYLRQPVGWRDARGTRLPLHGRRP
jgi:hypothetical protein